MDLMQAMKLRRARCEAFTDEPVPIDLIYDLIETTAWSLASWSLRPWRFIAVTDPEKRSELRWACYDQPVLEEAPIILASIGSIHDCDEMAKTLEEHLDKGKHWRGREVMLTEVARKLDLDPEYRSAVVVQAAYVAVEHFCLLAAAHGLGTANVNWFQEKRVRKVLDLPDYVKMATILAVGHPKGDLSFEPRTPPAPAGEITYENQYGSRYLIDRGTNEQDGQ